MKTRPASLTGAASVLAALSLSGCLTAGANPEDPYEDFNRQMFAFNDGLDQAVLEPVAHGYRAVTNEPIREGVGNVRLTCTIESARASAISPTT